MSALSATHLPLPNRRQGKVRDIYDLPESDGGPPGGGVLLVASDRISAFDVIMPTPITGKGRLLTQISSRWFELIRQWGVIATHLVSTDTSRLSSLPLEQRDTLAGRSMICRRCRVVPIECVVRGYLDGSGWNEYRQTGAVCGVKLPAGLRRADRLPQPIFTPATKEAVGTHDENIPFERACAIAGERLMTRLRDASIEIYRRAHEYTLSRGLILADTKFEFGIPDAEPDPILIDEALTPDSSRFWDASRWSPGGEQASFDKQFLREYLNRLVDEGRWNKQAPGPELPPDVVEGTRRRYQDAHDRLFSNSN